MDGDDNVVPFPSTPSRRFRIAKNKLKDYLFTDEPMHAPGSTHAAHKGLEKKETDNAEEPLPVHPYLGPIVTEAESPLAKHIKSAIQNSGLEGLEQMTRGEHFTVGEQEAKILSMDKYVEKRNMRKLEKSND